MSSTTRDQNAAQEDTMPASTPAGNVNIADSTMPAPPQSDTASLPPPTMPRADAGERVAKVPELLEMILLNLDPLSLLRAPYIAHPLFHATILSSSALCQKIFLSSTFNPEHGEPAINTLAQGLNFPQFRLSHGMNTSNGILRVTMQLHGVVEHCTDLGQVRNTLAANMFLTSPPRLVDLCVLCTVAHKRHLKDRHGEVTTEVKKVDVRLQVRVAPARIGDLIAVAREMLLAPPPVYDLYLWADWMRSANWMLRPNAHPGVLGLMVSQPTYDLREARGAIS